MSGAGKGGTIALKLRKAVKKAIKKKVLISRKSWDFGELIGIEPTNTAACCQCHSMKSGKIYKRWNPNAEDLVATDWIILKPFA